MLPFGRARVRSFRVAPALPEALRPLLEIAHNLWWTWNPKAIDLFLRLDRELWEETGHNPVRMLGQIAQEALDRAASDATYVHALSLTHAALREHLDRASWFQTRFPEMLGATEPRRAGDPTAIASGGRAPLASSGGGAGADARPFQVAYFSAEFGLTECLQIYSGGLGVLAGDHLKSASELAVPLIGVGLLYRCGYFHQYLNSDGWQQETYPDLDFPNQPIHRVIDPATGQQLRLSVQMPGRDITIGVWRCNVGRTPLFLLDTNFPENQKDDREITKNLYGGDAETRIKQEIVLGIGGVRALASLGLTPTVFHMNEGHSAFLSLERIREYRATHGVSFDEAREAAAAGQVFTTHTPVPAGIDRFSPEVMERYFRGMAPELGLDMEGLLALGRENVADKNEFFSMAALAIRTARRCNGVSRLHGAVSRSMWRSMWPGVPEEETPIEHVTNGVHARSWVKDDMLELFDRYLPSAWQRDAADHSVWRGVREIPDEEFWSRRSRMRERMVVWCRKKIRQQMRFRGAAQDQIDTAAAALDPNILTIGFARRFATYKRANLLLRNLERIQTLLNNDERPFQILIAGKSHPADGPGKELIRELVRFAKSAHHANRVVFLEDYDMDVGRRLVQGCDVWLNTPRRGMEASGTSGMKAVMNGGIHVSILDGWWDEAHDPAVGFAVGRGEKYEDTETQDEVESRALYDLLERQILPEFYERDAAGLPRKWIKRMKRSVASLGSRFNSNRMVMEYTERHYAEAHRAAVSLTVQGLAGAKDLARHVRLLREKWGGVSIDDVQTEIGAQVPIRSTVGVKALINLGGLSPEDVRVQVFHGAVSSTGDLTSGRPTDMEPTSKPNGHGQTMFGGDFTVSRSGRNGFSVRVIPREDRLPSPFIPGLITWDVEHDPNVSATRQVTDFQRLTHV